MYRTPAARPLPTFVLRASTSVTLSLLLVGVPTLLLGLYFSLEKRLHGSNEGVELHIAMMCAVLLVIVVGTAIKRWPSSVLLIRDHQHIVIEWRRGLRLLDAARVAQADIVDVMLDMRGGTFEAAGDCDLVLRLRETRLPLRYHASAGSCEATAKELNAFLWGEA